MSIPDVIVLLLILTAAGSVFYLTYRPQKSKEEKTLDECGCVTFCPGCQGILNEKKEVVGYAVKRYRGWYAEMIHTDEKGREFYHNECGDAMRDVVADVSYLNHFRVSSLLSTCREQNKSGVAQTKRELASKSWAN